MHLHIDTSAHRHIGTSESRHERMLVEADP